MAKRAIRRACRWLFIRRLMVYPERRVPPEDWAQMYRFEWSAFIWHLPGWRWQ